MSFLVCKLYKSVLYMTTYFWHEESFIFVWEQKLHKFNNTSFSNFSWSANDTILICKLYMPCLWNETLFIDMSEILINTYIDRFLHVAFVKYILSEIYSYCSRNCTFGYFLEIVETVVFWRKDIQNLVIFAFNSKTSNFHNSGMVGRRKLPDPSMKNIFNVL